MDFLLNFKRHYFFFIYLLIIPFFIIFSRSIFNAQIYLGGLVFFFLYIIKKKNFFINIDKDLVNIIFFAWIYLIFITVFIHDLSLKSLEKAIFFGFQFFFSLSLIYALQQLEKKKTIKIIFNIFFLLNIFIYLDLIYQFLNNEFKDILGFSVDTIRDFDVFGKVIRLPIRLSGPFGKELIPGFYLSTIGFLSIYFYFYFKDNFRSWYFFLITLCINFLLIILTGERTAVIMSIINLSFFFLFYKKFEIKNLIFVFSVFSILLMSIFLNPATRNRYNDIIFWLTKKENIKYSFLSTDWGGHYATAFIMIKKKPIFGNGIRSFRNYCEEINKTTCTTHPHNYIIEIISETGILFFLIFLFFVYKLFFKLKKIIILNYKNRKIQVAVAAVLLSYLFPFRPTGAFFASWYGAFFWIILSFKLYSLSVNNNK